MTAIYLRNYTLFNKKCPKMPDSIVISSKTYGVETVVEVSTR